MSSLQLHLLHCHLVCSACSARNEILSLMGLLLFVALLKRLNSTCCLLSSNQTLLVERAI